MKKIFLLFAFAVSLVFTSCNSDPLPTERHDVVYVLNSGNYSEHNGSIYLYDETTKRMENNIINKSNGEELGATIMDGIYNVYGMGYILCSNPDKIEIIDLYRNPGRRLTNPITDADGQLRNTREIMLGDNWIFVSNQGETYVEQPNGMYEYTNSFVSIFDANTNTLVGKVEVGSDAQDLVYSNNKLYVATKDGIVVVRCEPTGDFRISNTIEPEADFAGPVKHMCIVNGVIYASIPGKGIWAVSIGSETTVDTYAMELDYDGYLFLADDGYIYTYVNDYVAGTANVLKFDPKNGNVTSAVPEGHNFYSVGVSPATGNIFYSEPNDYITNSTMNVVDGKTGQIIDTQVAGVATYRYLFLSYYTYVDEEQSSESAM